MAAAFLNRLSAGRLAAILAGTEPAEAIDPLVVRVMDEVGIDISQQRPKRLTAEMVEPADKVITMGCEVAGVCPASFIVTEDWGLADPKGQPLEKVREIRDQIRTRVEELITTLRRV